MADRKSTRLNSSHTVIYTLSLHDALPISRLRGASQERLPLQHPAHVHHLRQRARVQAPADVDGRSEEHTSELQSHSDLHSFPTRRSSDLSTTRCKSRTTPATTPRPRSPSTSAGSCSSTC